MKRALLILLAATALVGSYSWGYHVGHFRGQVELIKKALEIKVRKGTL